MILTTKKIFALSKNKRLYNIGNINKPVGIYDVQKMEYDVLKKITENSEEFKISILLGEIEPGITLICLDLDDCFTSDGRLEPLTAKFLEEFNEDEYEVSCSGEGIHVYILTRLKDLETFIVKGQEGCKSFECYTNCRHIVTTYCDFKNINFEVGKHDKFLQDLYDNKRNKKEDLIKHICAVFDGKEITSMSQIRGAVYEREPIKDMYTLRGCGYKDNKLIEIIDTNPESVDQSAHDVALLRKLTYYCLDFDDAWEMAKKTNYYKQKDKRHKDKFNKEKYKDGVRRVIFG